VNKGLFIGLASIALLALAFIGTFISYKNDHVGLHNLAVAQQTANQVTFDKTWKVIEQQAGVASEYKDSFKEIFVAMTEARYKADSDNLLMKWVQENNPNFDVQLFKQLSSSIEAQRNEFANEQKKLASVKQQHDNLVGKFPGSLILDAAPLEIQIVTSSKTERVFLTGKEDDVDLFNKKKE